jgi:hypothetical protein
MHGILAGVPILHGARAQGKRSWRDGRGYGLDDWAAMERKIGERKEKRKAKRRALPQRPPRKNREGTEKKGKTVNRKWKRDQC